MRILRSPMVSQGVPPRALSLYLPYILLKGTKRIVLVGYNLSPGTVALSFTPYIPHPIE